MQKEDKERVVSDLTEKLRSAETLIVADYRGLTMPQIDALRGKLIENGARLSVVKNTLTRRAAEAAGADALLALLEGPSAIAFIEADGDMVAVAKALADSARETKVLEMRGMRKMRSMTSWLVEYDRTKCKITLPGRSADSALVRMGAGSLARGRGWRTRGG